MRRTVYKYVFIVGLFLILSALTACLGGDEEPEAVPNGQDVELAGSGTLACNQACADRGQCGTLDDGVTEVVLMTQAAPQVQGHDMLAPGGTNVTLLQLQNVLVAKNATQEQFNLRFYQVVVPDRPPAWVAGWCVEPAPQ